LLRLGEAIPEVALQFVAGQLQVGAGVLAAYAARPQTRREQLDALRAAFGFRMFAPEDGRGLLGGLLPVALATTSAQAVAAALMDELRRRRVVVSGRSTIERLVAAALARAERHVAVQLTRGLTPAQVDALEALLRPKEGTAASVLAWVRQPAGAPGHRALAHLVERLGILRAVGLDPSLAEGVHPERLRRLAREGGRFTAQHLRALAPLRRRATLVAAVLDAATRLTDDGVELFDRAVGRMFRRAEAREQDALLRDARAINDKVRLLARLGAALIEAREAKADLEAAVADAVGWDRLARGVAEAERLARPDKADLPALAARAWPVLHRIGPLFLDAFRLRRCRPGRDAARCRGLQEAYAGGVSGGRAACPPFLRPAWRDAVRDAGNATRRTWEGGHAARVARPAARRRHLGRGQPAVARRRGPAHPARALRRHARGRTATRPCARDRGGVSGRAARLAERRFSEVAAAAAADRLEDVRIAAAS
jgi:hypothetical protein